MDFSKYLSNPNPNTPTEIPYLLDNMERNQFLQSKDSSFKKFVPKQPPTSHTFKKPKRSFKSNSIPLYQSSKFQTPNHTTPRPRKPYWPKVYARKYMSSYASRSVLHPSYTPSLINPSESKKYFELLKNVQPGISTFVQGEVERIIRTARWEGMVSHLGKVYSVPFMGEFYTNMKVIKGIEVELHFTTSIKKKTIMINHKTINKALHLPTKLSDQPCVDFYSKYVFNKDEFNLMLGFLTDSDIPIGLCDENCGIRYKHFTPTFQTLALILKANVMPKPTQSKYFVFYDIKMLFLLCTNKISFIISYVILLNMINANFVEYMPYGLLISSLFDIFHIFMDENMVTISDSFISHVHVKPRVPLIHCEPQPFVSTSLPNITREEDVYLVQYEYVKMMFEEQKVEIKRLKTENNEIKGRLSYIEGMAAAFNQNARGALDSRNLEVLSAFQVNLVDDTVMMDGFESVGVGIGAQGIESLPEINDEFGFISAVSNGAGCSGFK